MGMYTGLRFKGTVKEEYRKNFEPIALDGKWYESDDEDFVFFGTDERARFIPLGALCYMPKSWDEEDKIEHTYNVETGYWTFQCSLKNYADTIGEFFDMVPKFIESVEYCEYLYEEWSSSDIYGLVGNKMMRIGEKEIVL